MIILMNSITDIPKLIANGGGEVDMPLISTVNYVLVQLSTLMTDSLFDDLETPHIPGYFIIIRGWEIFLSPMCQGGQIEKIATNISSFHPGTSTQRVHCV